MEKSSKLDLQPLLSTRAKGPSRQQEQCAHRGSHNTFRVLFTTAGGGNGRHGDCRTGRGFGERGWSVQCPKGGRGLYSQWALHRRPRNGLAALPWGGCSLGLFCRDLVEWRAELPLTTARPSPAPFLRPVVGTASSGGEVRGSEGGLPLSSTTLAAVWS